MIISFTHLKQSSSTPPTTTKRDTSTATVALLSLTTRKTLPTCIIAKIISVIIAITVVITLVIPSSAQASTASELSQKVEETSAAYDAAVAEQETLAAQVDELNARIAEIEEQLPGLQDASDAAMEYVYKNDTSFSGVIIQIITASDNISDLISSLNMMFNVMEYQNQQLSLASDAIAELEASKAELSETLAGAEEAVTAAEEAMNDAIAAREAYQENQKARASSSSTSSSLANDIDWSLTKEEFIAEWTTRIDNYLSGSAMAGCGVYYATAAWTYGVDPRWAPAISLVESTKGSYCFRSYNAWGYGSKSFSSWEEGIYTVVKALGGSLYGGNLTMSAASTYCPSNATHWYNTCYSEMKKI